MENGGVFGYDQAPYYLGKESKSKMKASKKNAGRQIAADTNVQKSGVYAKKAAVHNIPRWNPKPPAY